MKSKFWLFFTFKKLLKLLFEFSLQLFIDCLKLFCLLYECEFNELLKTFCRRGFEHFFTEELFLEELLIILLLLFIEYDVFAFLVFMLSI